MLIHVHTTVSIELQEDAIAFHRPTRAYFITLTQALTHYGDNFKTLHLRHSHFHQCQHFTHVVNFNFFFIFFFNLHALMYTYVHMYVCMYV